jgi:hypothetical protein
MTEIRVDVIVEEDGKLTVRNLPVLKGDRVEAILMLPDNSREAERQAARESLLERARNSSFCSDGKYPTRDELHERH